MAESAKHMSIDLNAHIDNIRCTVIAGADNTVIASISFDNLGYGVVIAVKFTARGYNSFGDLVPVDGQDSFTLLIQDLHIDKYGHAEDVKAIIPNGEIRKLDLTEYQVCYSDGMVTTYTGSNIKEITLTEYEDREIQEAVKDKYGSQFKYIPQDLNGDGWFCGCGQYNDEDTTACGKCGTSKDDAFKATNDRDLGDIVSNYRIKEEEKLKKKYEDKNEEKKRKIKNRIMIVIGMVVIVFIAILVFRLYQLSGRTIYGSEDEMKANVQGFWAWESNRSGNEDYLYINAYENQVTKRYYYNDGSKNNIEITMDIEKWKPKNGTFSTSSSTYIVLNTGEIKIDNLVYEKSKWQNFFNGSSKDNSSSSSYIYDNNNAKEENGEDVLKIIVDKLTHDSSYVICTGTVKNTGKKTYTFVRVRGAFKDKNGEVIDTDWSYAVGSEGLKPGESSSFYLSVPYKRAIESVNVTLLDFD